MKNVLNGKDSCFLYMYVKYFNVALDMSNDFKVAICICKVLYSSLILIGVFGIRFDPRSEGSMIMFLR